jgi:hypothetical protein
MTTITAPAIGTKMPDGTIYAGVSPDTSKPIYTTPKDAPLTCTFKEAAEYANGLDVHGHRDWRLPTKTELNVLFGNRAAIGGFDTTGSYPAGWYWSCHKDEFIAWNRRFSDGKTHPPTDPTLSALRCVRG